MRICDKCIHDKVCLLSKSRASCALFDEYRPHGEWIPVIGCDGRIISYKCKTCGWFKPHDIMPYCENCGSDNRPRLLDEAVDGEGKDGNVKEGEKE